MRGHKVVCLGFPLVAAGCAAGGMPAPVPRGAFYVAPAGTPLGGGSRARPWDLPTALAGGNGRVQPGDTVWLLGGTYHGPFRSTVSGARGAPVVVRQFPGERAALDGSGSTRDVLTVLGAWAVFQDFEITDSDPDRVTTAPQRPHGVVTGAAHTKYVHLVVHDAGSGFYTYPDYEDVEIYGCVIYNNGSRGVGHAIYGKSNVGPLVIRDNVIFNQFGLGIHVYSKHGGGGLRNITVRGNVSFDNGALDGPRSPHANLLVGGDEPVENALVDSNLTYFAPGVGVYNVILGWKATVNGSAVFRDNQAVGGAGAVLTLGYWRRVSVTGNVLAGPRVVVNLTDTTLVGYEWSGNTYLREAAAEAWARQGKLSAFDRWRGETRLGGGDNAGAGLPPAPQVFVRTSAYERGRATVVVYNWDRRDTVAVALPGVLMSGGRYEARDAQDFFGRPVWVGTYQGGPLPLPLGGVAPPPPIGGAPGTPPRTGPDFAVFIVMPARS